MRIGRRPWKTTGLLVFALATSVTTYAAVQKAANGATRARLLSEYGKLPISFEQNKGQTDGRVKFLSRGSGYALFLTPSEAVLSLANRGSSPAAIRMQFPGANASPALAGLDQQPGKTNYYIGGDSSRWQTNASQFAKVAYKELYRGIDLVYYGNQRQLEYDFVVAPGANPDQIRLKFAGVESMKIDAGGDLLLAAAGGVLRQHKPILYQDVNGERRHIDGTYQIVGDEVRFAVGQYDARKPLVIDPVLAWATYLGGNSTDTATAITVDATDAASSYVTGFTVSLNFPSPAQIFQPRGLEEDVFVTKYSPVGNAILFTTFLGGEKSERATSIALDSAGAVFIAGWTESTVLPKTTGNMQALLGGSRDAFVAKIDGSGGGVTWATYLGGFTLDEANAIKVDSAGRPVVAGRTSSTNFYTSTNALQGAYSSSPSMGFITKLTADGKSVQWSTYFGSTGTDEIWGLALDSTDAIYIGGRTNSLTLPFTGKGTIQQGRINTSFDGFVAKIVPTGTSVAYWTYLGGVGTDEVTDVAVDTAGNLYALGYTDSADYPLVAGALQGTNAGFGDVFLTKLNPTGTARVYSTFLGGKGVESPGGLAVDAAGSAYIIGSTSSVDFPVFDPFQLNNSGGFKDAFIAQISPAGTGLVFSTYMGGVGEDLGEGIALDSSKNVYVAGSTGGFPYAVTGSQQPTFGGGIQDAFVGKISNCQVTIAPASRTHLLSGAPETAGETSTIAITGASNCQWVATSNQAFVTITAGASGTSNGTVTYSVAQNTSAPRTAVISVGGQRFTVSQQGLAITGCLYPLEPTAEIVAASGIRSTFRIPTNPGCTWTATSSAPWLQVFPLSGTDTTVANYTVFPNFGQFIRTATITVASGADTRIFTVTQAAAVTLNLEQRAVTLAFSNFLGRYPTQPEIDFQMGSGLTRAQIFTNFFNSDEFALGGRFVAALYVGLLDRDAEYGGWLFQRNALATGQVNQGQLVANFINSAEFQQKWGPLTDTQFVILMYQKILGRIPIQVEVDYQVQQVALSGRAAVATAFLSVPEFRLRVNGRLSAFLLYATLLQRQPTAQEAYERQIYIDPPISTPIGTLIDQFLQSEEFLNQLR